MWLFDLKGPHRLLCLNAWYLVSGTVLEELGGMALLELVLSLRMGFEVLRVYARPILVLVLVGLFSLSLSLSLYGPRLAWNWQSVSRLYFPSTAIPSNYFRAQHRLNTLLSLAPPSEPHTPREEDFITSAARRELRFWRGGLEGGGSRVGTQELSGHNQRCLGDPPGLQLKAAFGPGSHCFPQHSPDIMRCALAGDQPPISFTNPEESG